MEGEVGSVEEVETEEKFESEGEFESDMEGTSPEGKVSSTDLASLYKSPAQMPREEAGPTYPYEHVGGEAVPEDRGAPGPSESAEPGDTSAQPSLQALGLSEQIDRDASGPQTSTSVSGPEVCFMKVFYCLCGLSPWVKNSGHVIKTHHNSC